MSRTEARLIAAAACAIVATGCGGGGGGGGGNSPPPPPPIVTLSANPASVLPGGTSTLTWSSTNATSCTASGGWTGARSLSGTEQVGPLNAATTFTLACGANGGTPVSTIATVTMTPTATVSGTISVPSLTQVDSDTNDESPSVTPVPNNSFTQAQTLPNPVIVGGYVNKPGTGEDGPLFTAGDAGDYYRVSLLAGQVIELQLARATPNVDDLDLALYNASQTLVSSSLGTGRIERITIAASGSYFVRVFPSFGASNYILTIGQVGTTALASDLVLDREFVPGELLVKAKPAASVGGATQKQAQVASDYGLDVDYTVPGVYSLMKLSDRTMDLVAASHKQSRDSDGEPQFESEEARLKWQTLQLAKALSSEPGIEWAEPNWILHTQAVPNDPLYPRQRWHYEQISLPAAWDITTGSANVIAAVVDTGVRPHPELQPRFVPGYDFVRGNGAGDGNDDDNDPSDPGAPSQGGTFSFHGTHVAGTIGAMGNDGTGATGVAQNVKIMPVRVLGTTGSGSTTDIIEGILFAARINNRSATLPAARADVINLSLGAIGACPSAFATVISQVRAQGAIVVAAAGNNNVEGAAFPGNCPGVVAVSSVGIDRARAPYSNFGSNVDVAAPGGDMSVDRNGDGSTDGIFSTYSTKTPSGYSSTYAHLQGTSMAAPHVAGIVALMKAVNSQLTPANFDSLLAAGSLTDDIGPAGPDPLGVGLINAAKAVRAAQSTPAPAPGQLIATPSAVNFGDVITANDVSVRNSGTLAVTVASTAVSAAWLSVTPGSGALGTYRITINRAGLAAGTYNGWVEFRGSTGTPVRATVLMQVAAAPPVPDAGHHYVILYDPITNSGVAQAAVFARGTSPVPFTMTNVPHGSYRLAAGTDMNNDLFICDEAEACADYPIFGEPETLLINSNRSGLNVLTGFHSSAQSQAVGETQQPAPKQGRRRLQ